MKYIVFCLSLFFVTASASAQVSLEGAFRGATLAPKILGEAMRTPQRPTASAPAAENIKLSYHDESLPVFDWLAPAAYNPYVIKDLGQRFTLPTANGHIDSVRIYFTAAEGARITVSLYKGSLTETGAGEFYLMDDFDPLEPFGVAVLEGSEITPNTWVTIPMGHAAVPKEFFVRVSPSEDGVQFLSNFTLRTEQEPIRARTTENSRSAFVGVVGQDALTALLDSTFYSLETGEILMGDFWMEVFADISSASVVREDAASVSIYPNPVLAHGTLRVEHPQSISSISIVTMLGTEILNWRGRDTRVQLSVAEFPKGIYTLLVTTDNGVRSQRVLVQ